MHRFDATIRNACGRKCRHKVSGAGCGDGARRNGRHRGGEFGVGALDARTCCPTLVAHGRRIHAPHPSRRCLQVAGSQQQVMVPADSWRTLLNQALTSASGHRRYHAGPGDCRRSAQPSASSLASLPHSNAGPWCVWSAAACLRCSPTFPIPTSSRACTPKVSALLLLQEAPASTARARAWMPASVVAVAPPESQIARLGTASPPALC